MKLQEKRWQNVSSRLGFPAQLNLTTGEIKFANVSPRVYLERKGKDLEKVWANSTTKRFENKTIHRIYRYIGDSPNLEKINLKLDITVILPGCPGGEFIKTTGHYHAPLKKNSLPSPDFYQLVFGRGIILIQKEENKRVFPYIIRPKLLEPVFIPPEYAHATINVGSFPVVFQNICVRTPHLNYEPILNRIGMAYFVKKGKRRYFSQNSNYLKTDCKVEKIRKSPLSLTKNSLSSRVPFYKLLQNNSHQLEFLSKTRKTI